MRALNDDDVRVMLMSTLCSVKGSDEPQLSHTSLTILETERADERADREADDNKN